MIYLRVMHRCGSAEVWWYRFLRGRGATFSSLMLPGHHTNGDGYGY